MGQKVIFQTPLTDVNIWAANQTQAKDQIGSLRFENNLIYKYVAFTGTTTVNVGDTVCYVAFATDGLQVEVDGANTAFGAGIAMAKVASGTIATNATYYATAWIQIRGIANTSTQPTGSPTIGYPLTTNGGAAPNLGVLSTTVATLATQQQCAWYYGTKTVICNFPF